MITIKIDSHSSELIAALTFENRLSPESAFTLVHFLLHLRQKRLVQFECDADQFGLNPRLSTLLNQIIGGTFSLNFEECNDSAITDNSFKSSMALTPFITTKKGWFMCRESVVSKKELFDFLCTKRECFEQIVIAPYFYLSIGPTIRVRL